MTPYKKYSREDQKALAAWAADCAEHVLPVFESARPDDERPRQAIEACRAWVRTGVFRMAEIRAAALAAHAAARDALAQGNAAACFAARAAGHAVGTAHVAQHAYGAAFYALKTIAASHPRERERAFDLTPGQRAWYSFQAELYFDPGFVSVHIHRVRDA